MSVQTETVRFDKYHGTGNDFVVVDADESVPDRPAFARAHCDRESGVAGEAGDAGSRRGADGVLFLALEEQYSPARVVMTLVQPDGSVAAMCGNGARCAAMWASDRTGADEFMIDTPAGTRHARVEADGEVTIEMGLPAFDPALVPHTRETPLVDEAAAGLLGADEDGDDVADDAARSLDGLRLTAVNTGVPHVVAVVDDVDAVELAALAPPLRHADAFPEGTNVTLCERTGDRAFRQRTFERGVEGETRSCGTGAVAVVAVAKRLGLVEGDDPVTVSPPGGELTITVPDRGQATLRGPVVREYGGELASAPDQ